MDDGMNMSMGANVPGWVTPVAWSFLVLALLTAVVIAVDIYLRGHRQAVPVMDVVWPLTALYLGPFALPLYARWGRRDRMTGDRGAGAGGATPRAVLGLPGGAASAAAHLIGVPLVALTGWTIAGMDMWAMIAVIGVLVLVGLFLVEYSTSAGITAGGGRTGVGTAVVVAAAVLVGFDLGMVGWMVLLFLGGLMPPATEGSFWFLMQIGVVIGLVTAYPVIRQLARHTSSSSAALAA